jgi:hypothetical protein
MANLGTANNIRKNLTIRPELCFSQSERGEAGSWVGRVPSKV